MPNSDNFPKVSEVRAEIGYSKEENARAAGEFLSSGAKLVASATEIDALQHLCKLANAAGDRASETGLQNRISLKVATNELAAAKSNYDRASEILARPDNGPSHLRQYQQQQADAKAAIDTLTKEVEDFGVAAGRTLHNIVLRKTSDQDLAAAQKSIELDQAYEPKWKNERFDDPQARVDLTVERYPAMAPETAELVRNDTGLFERAMEEADRLERAEIERMACEPYTQRPGNLAL